MLLMFLAVCHCLKVFLRVLIKFLTNGSVCEVGWGWCWELCVCGGVLGVRGMCVGCV